jgi:hypothetical protein
MQMRRDLVWETVQERAADPHASFGGMGVCTVDISAPVSCEMPRGLMMMGMIPWNFHPRTNTPKSHGDTNKDELLTGR